MSVGKFDHHHVGVNWDEIGELVERALRLPARPTRRLDRAGIAPHGERALDIIGGFVLLLFTVGWSWSIADARASEAAGRGDGEPTTIATSSIAAALTAPDARSSAYLTEATLRLFEPLSGASGRLKARIQPAGTALIADSLPSGAALQFASSDTTIVSAGPATPPRSGVWQLAIKVHDLLEPLTGLSIITLTPFAAKHAGRIGLYYLGTWPTERGVSRAGYVTPAGFVEVTREHAATRVSEHFTLGDFLTHDQPDVWPKYLVLDMRLVDKLELVIADLEEDGHRIQHVQVMSGFRTPQYNATGGDPSGRATLSRHMYGDAADLFIDNDRNGRMDDLDHDGRIDVTDATVVLRSVDRVEREHPQLVGGAGIYAASGGHGPFIHIDTRGYKARWVGTGDGG